MPYQYGNQANPDAHYNGTAVEILEELDEVTAFVAGLGTGGTLMGNARRLKEEDPDTLIVAAEPLQGELVQGLRSLEDGYIPPIIDLSLLDRKIFVSNRDAVVWTKKLLEEEGMFVGVSAGAIASICVRVAGELDEGNVVFVVPGRRLEVPQLGRLHEDGRAARGRGRPRDAPRSGRQPGSRPAPMAAALGALARSRSWSSSSSSSSSLTPASESFSSRIPRPTERAASGSRFGPSTSRATTRITSSSSGPGAVMKPIPMQATRVRPARQQRQPGGGPQRDLVGRLAGHDRAERAAQAGRRISAAAVT